MLIKVFTDWMKSFSDSTELCSLGFNPISTGLFCIVVALLKEGYFSTLLCKILYRPPRALKFGRLSAYILFYKICELGTPVAKIDVTITSLPKAMAKFGPP